MSQILNDLRTGEETKLFERFMGKQVYAKLIDFGALPTAGEEKSVAHGITDMDQFGIDYGRSYVDQGNGSRHALTYPNAVPNGFWRAKVNETDVLIQSGQDRSTFTAVICVWYTKLSELPGTEPIPVDRASAVPWSGVENKPSAFPPDNHAVTHATGGTDALTASDIDALPATGTAVAANKLATARTIAISGGATGTATSFDGSSNVTIPVTALDVSKATAGTLPVARGGTGNTTGNAATATKLATARTISLTGAVTGSANFDGSGNVNMVTSRGTAASQGYTQSLKTNGWCALPNGFMLQWGSAVVPSAGAYAYTFPTPFPTACLQLYLTDVGDNPHVLGYNSGTLTNTGVTITGGHTNDSIRWLALGY